MANELQSLKIGSTNYPIYSGGFFMKFPASNAICPLIVPRSQGTTSGIYTDLMSLNSGLLVFDNQDPYKNLPVVYKHGNISESDNNLYEPVAYMINSMPFTSEALTPTSSSTRFSSTQLGPQFKEFMDIEKGIPIGDYDYSGIVSHVFTLNPYESLYIPQSLLETKLHYASGTGCEEVGPYKYTIDQFYSIVLLTDENNNILAQKSSRTNTKTVTSTSSLTWKPNSSSATSYSQTYKSVYNNLVLPSLYYHNNTSNILTVMVKYIPFSSTPEYTASSCVLPIKGNSIYRNSTTLCYNMTVSYFKSLKMYCKVLHAGTSQEYFIRHITKPNNSCDLPNDGICFAKNGLWVGNKYKQLKIFENGITAWGNSTIKFESGPEPGLKILSHTGSNGLVSNLYIGFSDDYTSSTKFIVRYNDSVSKPTNLAVRPKTSGYGCLGRNDYYSAYGEWQYIYGYNIYKSGISVSTSDERYKDFIDDINIDFDDIKRIPKKLFTWKEGDFYDGKKIHVGTSAQKVKEIYPELVYIYNTIDCTDINDEKAILGVDYEKMSIIALAAIDKLNENINVLKEKLFNLQKNNIVLKERLSSLDDMINKYNI